MFDCKWLDAALPPPMCERTASHHERGSINLCGDDRLLLDSV